MKSKKKQEHQRKVTKVWEWIAQRLEAERAHLPTEMDAAVTAVMIEVTHRCAIGLLAEEHDEKKRAVKSG